MLSLKLKSSKSSATYVIICLQKDVSPKHNTLAGPMFSKDDTDFIDFLFGKLTAFVDVDEIDLHDDDTCCDHLELKAAELEMTVDEMLLMENTHL